MIAISYRREDSLPVAGRLYDRLQTEFGKGNVFMDFDSIPYGVDFRDHIKQMIDQSKVLVAMIGPDWVGRRRHRTRRIDDPADFVRLEIAYALNRKLPIIPVLVSNAQMPSPEQLPEDIRGLAFRNGLSLDVGIDFHHHAERLAVAINRILTTAESPKPPDLEKIRVPETPPPAHIPLVPPESRLEEIQPPFAKVTEKSFDPEPLRTPPAEDKDEAGTKRAKTQTAAAHSALVMPRRPRPPIIDLKAKIRAAGAALTQLQQATHDKLSAITSRVSRSFGSMLASIHSFARTLRDQLHHHRKNISLSALYLLVLMLGIGAIYLGLRSGTFHVLLVQTTELLKSSNVSNGSESSPQPTDVVPRAKESPFAAASPTTAPTPAQSRGALVVDTTPQGEAYEVIDSNNKHHIGKTPETLEDLPGGYAQVIFRREGFSDHTQTVWIATSPVLTNTRPSITWNFPDDYRTSPVARPDQNGTPTPFVANATSSRTPLTASPTANPATQSGRSWQTWIGDFVREFVIANESPDPNPTLACYAPTVAYFDEKNQDQAYIRQDIERYNVRWPIRHDEIEGDIRLQEKVPGQQCLASFKLNFYAESPQRNIWTKGQFAIDLEITAMDGVPKITSIREKTLHQQKGITGGAPKPSSSPKSYPYGIPVQGKSGFVKSPYAPSRGEIDIRRYPKGSQVKCPFTGKIFIAP
jgi:TIR domain